MAFSVPWESQAGHLPLVLNVPVCPSPEDVSRVPHGASATLRVVGLTIVPVFFLFVSRMCWNISGLAGSSAAPLPGHPP